MCTFNGERFLREQLSSFERQSYTNWHLWVSDDGSTDKTLDILCEYQRKWGLEKITISRGPESGFAANFISLMVRTDIQADYYALSDQDDIWMSEKLAKATKKLENSECGRPRLYCSRTELIDKDGTALGFSPYFVRPPSFLNALVQSIAGGNTMVFDNNLRDVVQAFGPHASSVVSHDWALYQLATGAGGTIIYDRWASVKYRQHTANAIGSNIGFIARIARAHKLLRGDYADWLSRNISCLINLKEDLEPDAQRAINDFEVLRKENLFKLPRSFLKSGFYRQTRVGNIGLFIGLVIGKV